VLRPRYHAAPCLRHRQPLNAGITIVLMEKFDARTSCATSPKYKVTHVHMVSTMFQRLLALPDEVRKRYDVSSLRHVLHGAAPTRPGQVRHDRMAGSESSTSTMRPARRRQLRHQLTGVAGEAGSVGKLDPAFGTRIVMSRAGRAVGESADLFSAQPDRPVRIFNDKEKTDAASLGESHFTVGDMAM